MTSRDPDSLPLPSEHQLFWAPERAILALLDANLLLVARTLNAAHAESDDEDVPSDALLIIARSIIAMTASLRQLIAGYDDIVGNLSQPQPTPPTRGQPDDDVSF